MVPEGREGIRSKSFSLGAGSQPRQHRDDWLMISVSYFYFVFSSVFFFNAYQNTDQTIEDEAFLCYVMPRTILFFRITLGFMPQAKFSF